MAQADEDEINLESLKLLKEIFDAADEDGSGELDIEEFCSKLGPHLGINLKRQQVAQLFMKIDANAGGTVDWDEFTNYMFLEKAQAAAGDSASDNWRLFAGEVREKNESSAYHHEQVDKLYFCASIDKYITCGRDGTFRLWNAADLKHIRTVPNGSSWITDCLYLPLSRKMVFTTMDRAITYYDINRGSYDLTGRVYASGSMGVPMALHVLSGDAGERVVYGDSKGAAVLLLCGSRELPARDLVSIDNHKDYIYLHKEHFDWITKIQWIPEVGLVSSSLDTTIKTFDINRERITHTCTHHAKGVHSFVWCKAYSCFASCGLERDVTVWHGTTGRKLGELRGHTSSVCGIALDDNLNHVFTLSIDKSIKVWDLRNHKCLQTILEDDWSRQDDSQPTCLMYDGNRRRLITANHRPYVWQHKVITQDRTGHREPVKGALYNSVFAVVVSVDEGGTTCVWNMQDGCREGRFTGGHENSRVTAVSFDHGQRRLVTAANDGTMIMWNFNNGGLIKRFTHDQQALEITEVLFARDEKRGSDIAYAAGWNAKVFVWEDEDDEQVSTYKAYEGHTDDILAMAAYTPKQWLATGDYQGRIIIWGLMTGEKKACISNRGGDQQEASVERLLWLPAYSPQQRHAATAAAAALTASAATLAVGGSNPSTSSFFAPVGPSAASADQQRQQQQQSKTASGVPLVVVPSLASLGSEMSVMGAAGHQTHHHHHQQQQQPSAGNLTGAFVYPPSAAAAAAAAVAKNYSIAKPGSADGITSQDSGQISSSGGGEGVDDEDHHEDDDAEAPDAVLLLSAGGNGVVCVWNINHLGQGQMLCTLPGAQAVLDVISAAGADDQATVVVLGDSGGHLRVFDVAAGIDTSSSAAAAASFKQRAHWQAHDGAISSVSVIPSRPVSGYSNAGSITSVTYDPNNPTLIPPLIVSGSRDSNVSVWTLAGGLVGVLGEHSWDLDDQTTWQDPKGVKKRPPKPEVDGMYLKISDSELQCHGNKPTCSSSSNSHGQQAAAVDAAGPQLQHRRSMSTAAGSCAVSSVQRCQAAGSSSEGSAGPAALVSESGQLSMATLILQESKQKRRESMVARPAQPHCQLKVHELQDVEGTAGEILKAAAEKRKGKGRNLVGNTSTNSHISSWSGVSHVSRAGTYNWRQQH